MQQGDNRQIARDSLFLMADLRLKGRDGEHRVRVRNLSPGGMMGEGAVDVLRGTLIEVKLRNIGWVSGAVAWVQESRFGIAFEAEIDPKLARAPTTSVSEEPGTMRFVQHYEAQYNPESTNLRKI
ncbi:PilZ domain-containing protein [Novosphingobium sp. 9]|uniref:PilZ domain-containing protein n=1 Tax=Novosphingobium sp. 9 TaxID=2025349 RepID=UPI0021B602DE|nr:PilZ domain-containing protein [Novosphingobium sp. 9]